MGLIVRVLKGGLAPEIKFLREISHSLGEDARGIFVTSSPSKCFFSLLSHDGGTYLEPARRGFQLNGAPVSPGDIKLIMRGDSLRNATYEFLFFPVEQLPESLAASGLTIDELAGVPLDTLDAPRLEYRLSNLRRSYILFDGKAVTAGSHESCEVLLNYPGIMRRHCSIQFNKKSNSFSVLPLEGRVSVDGRIPGEPLELPGGGLLKFEPGLFECRLIV